MDDEHEKEWLENDVDQDDIQKLLNYSYDQTQLEYHPVSSHLFHPKVNSDVESTLDRIKYEGLEI
ncbi:MAG: putative SOS response-associated peptidase YedK [Glaciecola sp.]